MSNSIFSTRDLALAATLVTLKFYMEGLDFAIEGGKNFPVGYFKFTDTPELQEAKKKYSQGLLLVEPKIFMSNIHELKSQVANIRDNPHTQG